MDVRGGDHGRAPRAVATYAPGGRRQGDGRRCAARAGAAIVLLAGYPSGGFALAYGTDTIVLGGGLSSIGRLYERVPRLWVPHVFSDRIVTRLCPPLHGDSSGVRGAAWGDAIAGFDHRQLKLQLHRLGNAHLAADQPAGLGLERERAARTGIGRRRVDLRQSFSNARFLRLVDLRAYLVPSLEV